MNEIYENLIKCYEIISNSGQLSLMFVTQDSNQAVEWYNQSPYTRMIHPTIGLNLANMIDYLKIHNPERGFGPVPHWIDCKERLPDQSLMKRYIVALINDSIILGRIMSSAPFVINNKYLIIFDTCSKEWYVPEYYAEPTHWCLLPEVPK